jgi:hypothetical protein
VPEAFVSARDALETAQREVAILEGSLGLRSAGDLDQLERAHTRVDEARGRAERSLAGPGAKRRLADAEVAERHLLDQLGFASYVDHQLQRAMHKPDPNSRERLEVAKQAVADARAVLDELERAELTARARQALNTELDGLRARAVCLLGSDPGPDLFFARRAAVVDQATARATAELRAMLEATGAYVGADVARAAEAWLARVDEDVARRDALEAELHDLDAEVAAREAVTEAGAATEVGAAVMSAVDPLVAHHDEAVDLSQLAPGQLELYLLSRIAAQRAVGEVGSVPLIVDDALAGAPTTSARRARELLERMADVVQVLYLSEDPEVAAWAQTLGSDRASVTSWSTGELEFPRPAPIAPPASLVAPEVTPHPEPDDGGHGRGNGGERAVRRSATCVRCPFPTVGRCDQCGGDHCSDHLVLDVGRRRHTMCLGCALVAAGVRQR